jgi:hypothetical protein
MHVTVGGKCRKGKMHVCFNIYVNFAVCRSTSWSAMRSRQATSVWPSSLTQHQPASACTQVRRTTP